MTLQSVLSMVGRKGSLTRQEVTENPTLLAPVSRHLGFSVKFGISMIVSSSVYGEKLGYLMPKSLHLPVWGDIL